jgi:hypothetical protein
MAKPLISFNLTIRLLIVSNFNHKEHQAYYNEVNMSYI